MNCPAEFNQLMVEAGERAVINGIQEYLDNRITARDLAKLIYRAMESFRNGQPL